MSLSPRLEGFLDRVTALGDKSTAMKQLSRWMTKNLRLKGRPYSFKDHEMHIQIAADQHPHKCVSKPAQVGLTELSLRSAAAIAAVIRATIIYVFPSAKFSEKMSQTRFLPIIEESQVLRALVDPKVQSASMRKIGKSIIYFNGATGTTQAISVPATHLIFDEEDFCDPNILTQYNARIKHAPEDPVTGLRGVIQRFSTPTVPNYGVTQHLNDSDYKQYMVKCSSCNVYQAPDYYSDYVIPGYDKAIDHFDKTDLYNPKYRVKDAYVKCQKCGKDLWQDLMNPTQREWVAKYPEKYLISGYAVSPIDVPAYNKIPAIFYELDKFSIQDHRNFTLGIAHEDKHNSFLMSIFMSRTDAFLIDTAQAKLLTLSGVRIGIDIGKTAHLVVGKRKNSHTKDMDIIYMVQLSTTAGTLVSQIQPLIDVFSPDTVVLDAGPDFTTPQILIEDNPYGRVFGCEYHRKVKGAYTNLDPDPETGVVKAARTGTLKDTMKRHNDGAFHYSKDSTEVDILKQHLKVTKKVSLRTEFGGGDSFPKPTEPDHYAHALNYLNIADTIASDHDILPRIIGVAPQVVTVAIGSGAKG